MKKPLSNNRNDRCRLPSRFAPISIERLEARSLMAAEIFLDNVSGNLYVEGTDAANDVAEIKIDTKGTASVADDRVMVKLTSFATTGNTNLLGNYSPASVKSIVFNGYNGNDKFDNQTSIPSEADGGLGSDILLGGYGNDKIYGGDGNDYLDGRTGNDWLYGMSGHDLVFGDRGNDVLYGGSGNDQLFGGDGLDYLYGEAGADLLDGGAGVEGQMHGGTEADLFVDDTLSFPNSDLGSLDKSSTTHSKLALFDYNVADNALRSSSRLQSFLNPTPTPPPTPVSLNNGILSFAQSKLGQKVGDGGCTRLVEAALAAVGAKPGENLNSPGFYVWGAKLAAGAPMLAGDIIQFAPGTKFQTANSSLWMDSFFGHAGIIESVNGSTITILNQNMAGSPVIRTTINLSTIVAGSFSVYRAVPK